MAVAVAFAVIVFLAGFGLLRWMGVIKGALSLGLAPAVGLAAVAVVCTWATALGLRPPLAGAIVLVMAGVGLFGAFADRTELSLAMGSMVRANRIASLLLVAAFGAVAAVMQVALPAAQVPLSPHDGAMHTQATEALRYGLAWSNWYPPGLPASFAAVLQLLPWLDTAAGTFELGMGLSIVAVLAVFGIGQTLWGDLRVASAAALFSGLTYLFPHFPQLWSGWPLLLSLTLLCGAWIAVLEFVRNPGWRWAAVAGLVVGAIVLVHGSEIYSLVIVLVSVLLAHLRRIRWSSLPRALPLALAIATACAWPYLPTLFHWAGVGGAYAVGLEDVQGPQAATTSVQAGPSPFVVFAFDAFGVDVPIRVLLVALGIGWTVRHQQGRTVVAVGIFFAGLATIFNVFYGVPFVREVYALSFPWSMHYRLFMFVAIIQALLAARGAVWVFGAITRAASGSAVGPRLVRRALHVLLPTWILVATWGMAIFLAYPAGLVLGYSADDDAAMRWLRDNADPAGVVINDGYADAGIWTPYKAGLAVLWPRVVLTNDVAQRKLVSDNVARLERVPEARAAACALHVGYVYVGAKASEWDARAFPPTADLERSGALQEVFRSGDAVVFQVKLSC